MSPARKVIAVDVDGTLAQYKKGWQGFEHFEDPIEGAADFVRSLQKLGDVLIYTTRTSTDGHGFIGGQPDRNVPPLGDRVRWLQNWLRDHDIPYDDIWTRDGKPHIAAIVDDRAVSCRPQDGEDMGYTKALQQVSALVDYKSVAALCVTDGAVQAAFLNGTAVSMSPRAAIALGKRLISAGRRAGGE